MANQFLVKETMADMKALSAAEITLRGAGIYLIEGKVVVEYGCPSIEVIRCAKMPLKPYPRSE